jgi:O-antigen/teichoic acid export membrane protein
MISKGFIKQSVIYTVAGALPMASAIILLPFYITMLPTSVYGALSLYLAFSLFVQIVVAYSFDSSLYIHYHEYKNDFPKLSSFVSSAFIFMLFISIGVGVTLSLLGDVVFGLVFNDDKISFLPFGLMAVGIGIFQALFKVYSNLMQSREQPLAFLWSNLLLFTLIAGFTISGLYIYPNTLLGPIGGRMIAGGIVAVWVLFRVFTEFGVQFNFAQLRETFSFNYYTFIYQLQLWAVNYIDRFLMVLFLPLSDVGIYDFAMKCLVAIEYIMTGLYNSFYPKVVSAVMAQTKKETTVEINRYYHGLTAMVLVMITASILVLPFIVDLLKDDKGYGAAVQYFPLIATLYLFKAMRLYFSMPYGILKETKLLAVYYFIISLFKIGILFLVIKPYGITGVIGASILASCVDLVILRVGIRSKFDFQFNVYKLVVMPLLVFVTIVIAEPLFAQSFSWQIHLVYVLLSAALLIWYYRNEIKFISFKKILSKK